MGLYRKAVITDTGNELIAQALAGEITIRFTHTRTSDYAYPDGTNLNALTGLQGIMQSVTPSDAQVDDHLISVRSMFGNENILTPYLIQTIGLYAADEGNEVGEVLFAVCQADEPDQVPVYNGVAPSSFIFNIQLAVSEAKSLQVSVNPAGTATVQDVLDLRNEMVKRHQTLFATLIAAGWIGDVAPYEQTVEVAGAAADLEAILVSALAEDADAAAQKAYVKAFGIISSGTAVLGDGTATFRVYKKPEVDCTVGLKGV